ncbi:MAG: hypothetical protein JW953_06350, partial [Anaerolineae bacterium]|nr:hypothetical protein [Anaerolineae bacterium]
MPAHTQPNPNPAHLIWLTTPDLTLGLDRRSGALVHLSPPDGDSVIQGGRAALDARLNGAWLNEPTRYLAHTIEKTATGTALAVTLALGPLTLVDRFHLLGPLIERTVRVCAPEKMPGQGQLNGVRFIIPGVAVGDPAGCRFEAPASAVRPRLPLSVAA